MSSIDRSNENSTQIPGVSSWTHFKLGCRSPAGCGSDGFGYRFVLPHRKSDKVHLANEPNPPMRFFAGSLAVKAADEKLTAMREELANWRELSLSTDGNFGNTNVRGFLAQIK